MPHDLNTKCRTLIAIAKLFSSYGYKTGLVRCQAQTCLE